MKTITLKRVVHREASRIAMKFKFDPVLISIAKGITGVKFSSTNQFWYADDKEETLREILRAFQGEAEVDISAISLRSKLSPIERNKDDLPEKVNVMTSDSNEISDDTDDGGDSTNDIADDISIKSVEPEELVSARDFKNGNDFVPVNKISYKKVKTPGYSPVEFRVDDNDGRLYIRFTGYYDKEWYAEIRSYGNTFWDKIHREVSLPWSKVVVDSLSDYFSSRGVAVRVIRQKPPDELKVVRRNFGDEIRSRELKPEGYEGLELLRRYLEENRYSVRTVESYLALLELFFKFFNEKSPYDIIQNEVSGFMNDFIIKNGFSASYQNQMVSAIKLFYEISGSGRIIPQTLERPRRGRALPKVFSKEEVSLILNSTRNNKHKLLLWMIYSCGLRRSEATNIKLEDLDRTRNLLHIREGKGGVDRIVPVPDKVWNKIDEYKEAYKPRKYLFEGSKGARYSVESVYNVFRQSLRRAGINREVGVHSLRHSYATHLHENGLDIRYIQELLGHKSTRTTEIYTHVSRRNLVTVRSPIEDLDLK